MFFIPETKEEVKKKIKEINDQALNINSVDMVSFFYVQRLIQAYYTTSRPEKRACNLCHTIGKSGTCKNCGAKISEIFASANEFIAELEYLADNFAGEPEQSDYLRLVNYAKERLL